MSAAAATAANAGLVVSAFRGGRTKSKKTTVGLCQKETFVQWRIRSVVAPRPPRDSTDCSCELASRLLRTASAAPQPTWRPTYSIAFAIRRAR
jgi:hypothetical protein